MCPATVVWPQDNLELVVRPVWGSRSVTVGVGSGVSQGAIKLGNLGLISHLYLKQALRVNL